MTTDAGRGQASRTAGLVVHGALRYDLFVWLATLGGERALRETILRFARLARGEAVLDVGCGTGTLAITAKSHVGEKGVVHGIDASPEMIARAARKARRAGAAVTFATGFAQSLPYPDGQFDVVLSTVMLHHVPSVAREACAREMRRVLKPGGRVLVVDFGKSSREAKGLIARLHRHGRTDLRDIIGLLTGAGLSVTESGAVGVNDLQFVTAVAGVAVAEPAAPSASTPGAR